MPADCITFCDFAFWQSGGENDWQHASLLAVCRYGADQIAQHGEAPRRHVIVRNPEHHVGNPLGARPGRKTLVHLRQTAPVVIRSLGAYESVAVGGAL